MRKSYHDISLPFSVGDTGFHAQNFVYEQFFRTIPRHAHGSGSYEIHYISEGYGQVLTDGLTYALTPNTLFVTGPRIEHAQIPDPECPMCEYCVYLKTEQRRRGQSSRKENPVPDAFLPTHFWLGQDTWHAGRLLRALFEELDLRKTGWELQAEALLKQLLVSLVRNYEKEAGSPVSSPSRFTDRTSFLIEEYFLYQYKNLSLADLSAQLGLGTRQTERLLQKKYGKSFLQKKAEARMSAAAILLADSSRSITSIAEELGYSSIEHFSSAFRKYYAISPRQFRKENP